MTVEDLADRFLSKLRSGEQEAFRAFLRMLVVGLVEDLGELTDEASTAFDALSFLVGRGLAVREWCRLYSAVGARGLRPYHGALAQRFSEIVTSTRMAPAGHDEARYVEQVREWLD